MMDGPEMDEIRSAIGNLAEAVRMVCEKQCAMDEELDKILSGRVMERLDGVEKGFDSYLDGVNGIITDKQKGEYGNQLREKHPELGRYDPVAKRFGLDVFKIATDNTFDMPEESREGAISAMLDELKGKFDDLVGLLESQKEHEAKESPEAEKAEQGEGGNSAITVEVEGDDGLDPKIKEMARKFRGRDVK